MGLYILRHPETLHNQAKVFPDYSPVAYSKRGEEQLRSLMATDFKIEHIFSSPIKRAKRMALALAPKYQLEVVVDDRLREIDLGQFGGLTFEQVEARFPELIPEWMENPWDFQYPGGEAYPELVARVEAFLAELPDHSLICSHQAVCQVIAAKFDDQRPVATGEWRYYARK